MQHAQLVRGSADAPIDLALRQFAATTPEQTALCTPCGAELSYAELDRETSECAAAISWLGTDAPPVVGILSRHALPLARLLLASSRANFKLTPFEPTLPLSMLVRQINDAGCTHLFVDDEWPHEQVCARVLKTKMPVVLHATDLRGSASASGIRHEAMNADSSRLLLRTSGTTGRPKQVELSPRVLAEGARRVIDSVQLCATDAGLCVMPLSHVHGLVAGLLAPLLSGGRVVLCPSQNAVKIFETLTTDTISWFSAVPSIHLGLIDTPGFKEWLSQSPSLRVVRSASSALPEQVREFYATCNGPRLIEAYGMTEAAHQITSQRADATGNDGSVGLVDADRVRVDTGTASPSPEGSGEVVLRRSFCAEETGADENGPADIPGWFRTGDIGHIDADGNLFLTGRIKEMINRGGESIAPVPIDDVLASVDGVSQAATFGAPHPTLGEVVAAAVVVDPLNPATVSQLQQEARRRLPMSHAPVHYIVVESLPTTMSGKLNRAALPAILDAETSNV